MTLGRAWLDHFVKGDDNGVDEEPRVQIAPDPWTGKPAEFPALPATRTALVRVARRPEAGRLGREDRPPRRRRRRTKIEDFGSPS